MILQPASRARKIFGTRDPGVACRKRHLPLATISHAYGVKKDCSALRELLELTKPSLRVGLLPRWRGDQSVSLSVSYSRPLTQPLPEGEESETNVAIGDSHQMPSLNELMRQRR